MRGRPVSQVDIEADLLAEAGHLEALTSGGVSPRLPDDGEILGYDDICDLAASKEADWKIAEARFKIDKANKATGRLEAQHLLEARAMVLHENAYRDYKRSAAVKESRKEALATSRARIGALQTVAANQRTQT